MSPEASQARGWTNDHREGVGHKCTICKDWKISKVEWTSTRRTHNVPTTEDAEEGMETSEECQRQVLHSGLRRMASKHRFGHFSICISIWVTKNRLQCVIV